MIAQKIHRFCVSVALAGNPHDQKSHYGALFGLYRCGHRNWQSCGSKERSGFEAGASFMDYKRADAMYKTGRLTEALQILDDMDKRQTWAVSVAFVQLLQHCSGIKALRDGKQIHAHVKKCGFESDIFVANTLVSMYAKCGSLLDACQIFDRMPQKDAVSWNAMIAGYAKHGNGEQALRLYQEMKLQGLKPNKVTFICILNACASLLAIEHGKRVHADISEARFESDVVVGSALVDMYIKCGSLVCARTVFNKMPKRNVISWTTLIGGYVKHGRSKHALKLSYKMKQEGIKPNEVTYICILNACASLADLAKGKQVHFDIIKAGYELDTKVGNALVDMYVKCANLLSAQNVFSRMLNRDTISWSTMIAGYLTFGSQDKALQLFGEMQRENVKPDDVTFINLLSVCSHVGLLNEGLALFESMTRDYGLTPRLEHYGCLVDLFGRAGRLEEADAFIKSMPIQPDASVWMALLGACKVKADIELAERISRHILKVDPQNEAVYVVLSNVYAAAGKWDAKMGVRKLMEERGVSKDPGRCWI